jgi:DeoR family fructose operon transcriptional repressor
VAAVDAWATDALAQSYVEVAFLATNGVSARRGLTTPDLAEAAVKRAMIAAARRVVLLADHTKASVDHLVRFGELGDVDTLVTDSGLDERTAAEIASYGPRVVRA